MLTHTHQVCYCTVYFSARTHVHVYVLTYTYTSIYLHVNANVIHANRLVPLMLVLQLIITCLIQQFHLNMLLGQLHLLITNTFLYFYMM
jgi:hypothetical protein